MAKHQTISCPGARDWRTHILPVRWCPQAAGRCPTFHCSIYGCQTLLYRVLRSSSKIVRTSVTSPVWSCFTSLPPRDRSIVAAQIVYGPGCFINGRPLPAASIWTTTLTNIPSASTVVNPDQAVCCFVDSCSKPSGPPRHRICGWLIDAPYIAGACVMWMPPFLKRRGTKVPHETGTFGSCSPNHCGI